MAESDKVLANISNIKNMLVDASNLRDVLDIRDASIAVHAYAKAKNSDEVAQLAMDLKLRAERKAGGFLEEREKPKNQYANDIMSLADLGVSNQESSRWQRIALIPDELFESYLINAKNRTQSALLVEASRQIRPEQEGASIDYPTDVFPCIVIDPPWPIKKIMRVVRPMQKEALDYPTMSIDEIAEIPIPKLAYEDGCHVYLWVTQKYLPIGLGLFETWGVKYQCLLTWVKPGGITPFTWMYNTEHVLFGRIGSLPLLKNGIKLSFSEPTREHSRKPEIFYDIVKTASPGPRLELFARQPREGFTVWGDETDRFRDESK